MIGVLSYGLGNVGAFSNIYEKLGKPWRIVGSPSQLDGVSHLILPGVGAFDEAMQRFRSSGFCNEVTELVNGGLPILGVCVGMQMMAHGSDEGETSGLGWLDGVVKVIPNANLDYNFVLPHMGWNRIKTTGADPQFDLVLQNQEFYFLHSYYFSPSSDGIVVAEAEYSVSIPAVVRRGNIFGMQCHPEKSHDSGVAFLEMFAEVR